MAFGITKIHKEDFEMNQPSIRPHGKPVANCLPAFRERCAEHRKKMTDEELEPFEKMYGPGGSMEGRTWDEGV